MPLTVFQRYKLLLSTLLQHTKEDDPEREVIQKALESIETIASSINKAIREHEELEKLVDVARHFVNCPVCPRMACVSHPTPVSPQPIVIPNRVFIRDGALCKICRRSPKMRHFFLFSDCLVYAKRVDAVATMYMFHRLMMLKDASLVNVPDSARTVNSFQILSREKSFTLCAKDAAEKEQWMQSISDAKDALGHVAGDDGQAPVWVPDDDSEKCMGVGCNSKFTVVNRRVCFFFLFANLLLMTFHINSIIVGDVEK